eukprot:gnl/MRDRNA2_/MRDRNA2_69384_c0_seq2.p1 gnl/MRDRNA2_/MRDRNA2_69384_c0~~gnl/MRDRNA2_/MRDRNA2_69384_c0_seq2.p1  ORF type:complete len:101 (+),score=18.88 gnl/MRDRNA2_/MRDRNA2_69384_c0_seq2:105-407(+)
MLDFQCFFVLLMMVRSSKLELEQGGEYWARQLKGKGCVGKSYCCLQDPQDESLFDAEQGTCLYGQQHKKGVKEKCEAKHCSETYYPCVCMTQVTSHEIYT